MAVISWRRTKPLRRGLSPGIRPTSRIDHPGGPDLGRSSEATRLASLAGALLCGTALSPGWSIAGRIAVGAIGAFVLATGVGGRVKDVRAESERLSIGYAGRPRFTLRWSEIQALTPPRTFVGGWRIHGIRGARTLMPSDLLGWETILATIVLRAGLSFDSHVWRKDSDPRSIAAAGI